MAFEYILKADRKITVSTLQEMKRYLENIFSEQIDLSENTILIKNNEPSKWTVLLEMYITNYGLFLSSIMNRKFIETFIEEVTKFLSSKNYKVEVEEE